MKLFNRKDKSASEEIQDYYAGQQRERKGITWLLGLATLVVTLLLAFGIFYGGRWAYRAIFDDSNEITEVAEEEPTDEPAEPDFTIDAPDDSADQENQDTGGEGGGETTPTDGEDATPTPAQPSATDGNGNQNLPASGALPSTGPSEPEL